jgi:hypothetical protein
VLTRVGHALAELGLAGDPKSHRYDVNITTGDALSIAVFLPGGRFLQVKASEFVNLAVTYDACLAAWQRFPHLVPRPLGHRVVDGWSIFVSEGVPHSSLRRADVVHPLWRRPTALGLDLLAYFAACAATPGARAAYPGHASLLARVADHFESSPLAPVAREYLGAARSAKVDSMAVQLQHGDFVMNNLGRANGRLVVFDWEDHGEVGLPGFDLGTFTLSLLGFDAGSMRALTCPAARRQLPVDAFLDAACRAQALDPAVFRRLLPAYLLVFLYLKRKYGQGVQDRIGGVLWSLRESNGAVDVGA